MADLAHTLLDDRVNVLSIEEKAATGCTHKIKIGFEDINGTNNVITGEADGDTVTVKILDTPGDYYVPRSFIHVNTAFATDGTLTGAFGSDGDPDDIINEVSVKTAGLKEGALGGVPLAAATDHFGIATDVLQVQFATQASTGKPSDITAGELDLYFQLINFANS